MGEDGGSDQSEEEAPRRSFLKRSLGVAVVGFALISYIGRLGGAGKDPRGGYVLAGSAVLLCLMFLVLLA
ncbi:MAG TPA: hypothetical protein VEJ19_00060 [Nitrososphaerales archaeon]|nr:hypothetical protein [Nitrososphaerales archaeon]